MIIDLNSLNDGQLRDLHHSISHEIDIRGSNRREDNINALVEKINNRESKLLYDNHRDVFVKVLDADESVYSSSTLPVIVVSPRSNTITETRYDMKDLVNLSMVNTFAWNKAVKGIIASFEKYLVP